MRANIQVLCMEDEIDVTLRAIDSVLIQTTENDTISVLLNGGRSFHLREMLSGLSNVHYYESDENLGVAGGRNFLLSQEEAKRSAVNMFIDNDAFVPYDYIERVVASLSADSTLGVLGCIVLIYQKVRDLFLGKYSDFEGHLGTKLYAINSEAILGELRASNLLNVIDHIGTNQDSAATYFVMEGTLEHALYVAGIISERQFQTLNAADPVLVKELLFGAGVIPAANIAGCCQAFRRSLVDEVGMLNDIYNPFGFEDVDFCYRVAAAGYRNIVSASTFMFHHTDDRHAIRKTPFCIGPMMQNEFRVRTLFDFLHDSANFPRNSLQKILARFLIGEHLANNLQYQDLYNDLRGFRRALQQISEHYPDRYAELTGLHDYLAPLATSSRSNSSADVNRFVRFIREVTHDSGVLREDADQTARRCRATASHGAADSIERFRNLHKGERCFIIGNGPSLLRIDLNALAGEVTFVVNGIFYMTDDIGFEPTYYVVEDNHVVEDNLERINRLSAKAKFFPSKYRDMVLATPETYFLNTNWQFYFKSSPHFETPRFSRDCAKEIFVGQTVTYLNMQLAHFMGFDEVYLIGMDFSYSIPQNSGVEGYTLISRGDDPNHFHPAYFGRGKKWHFPKLHNCRKVFKYARDVYEQDGRLIANATVGGKLDVFERRQFQDVLKEPIQLESPNKRLLSLFLLLVRQLLKSMHQPTVAIIGKPIFDDDWHTVFDWLATWAHVDIGRANSETPADLLVSPLVDSLSEGIAATLIHWSSCEYDGPNGFGALSLLGQTRSSAGLTWILGDAAIRIPARSSLPLTGFASRDVIERVRQRPRANLGYLRYILQNEIGLGEWIWFNLSVEDITRARSDAQEIVSILADRNIPFTFANGTLFARL